MTAVLTIDDHAGKRQHKQRWDRLQDDYSPERHLGMRHLKDVPDHSGGVHAAAQHGDQIGDEDEAQAALPENCPHEIQSKRFLSYTAPKLRSGAAILVVRAL